MQKVVAAVPALCRDLAGISGAGCMTYGAWLAYRPAGFVLGGAFLITASFLLARTSE